MLLTTLALLQEPATEKGDRMRGIRLSNRELAAAYRLEASRLVEAARQIERKAHLIELAETVHDLNAKLSRLCPDYILRTFEEELGSHEQDRKFLAQRCIASSPFKSAFL